MKKKHLWETAALFVLLAFMLLPVKAMAAPLQMPDGNVFDAEYYAQQNPDVVAVLGTDPALLYRHYLTCGKTEGRLPYAKEIGPDYAQARIKVFSAVVVADVVVVVVVAALVVVVVAAVVAASVVVSSETEVTASVASGAFMPPFSTTCGASWHPESAIIAARAAATKILRVFFIFFR